MTLPEPAQRPMLIALVAGTANLRACAVVGGSEPFDFEQWFWDFAMSAETTKILGSYCRRYGLHPHELDDVRSEWMLRVTATFRRSGLPERVQDPEEARPYVLLAGRRTAHDLGCRGPAQREEVRDFTEATHLQPMITSEIELAPDLDPGQWCDQVRAVISARFQSGSVDCPGCTAAAVVQYALAVIASIYDEDETSDGSRTITGGATEFARRLYDVIERVRPEMFEVDDRGRVAQRTRAHKNRCEPCVIELLVEAVDEVRRHTDRGDLADGPGGSGLG